MLQSVSGMPGAIPEHSEPGSARPGLGPRQARPQTLLGGRGQRS
jgi:hypothetical protein